MTNDKGEEAVQQQPREKSLCWRFLNWLSEEEKKKKPNQERTTRTYLRLATEERLISSSETTSLCDPTHLMPPLRMSWCVAHSFYIF